jgi:hypothetical protein
LNAKPYDVAVGHWAPIMALSLDPASLLIRALIISQFQVHAKA